MHLIAGLGNPGKQYSGTRHNIGFRVVSALADKYGLKGENSSKFTAIVAKGPVSGVDAILVEPLTFMNLSGQAILKILNWYKIDQANLLVIFDDIDLNLGRIRFRKDGSDGGHNGIKSIISCLGGNNNFARLKMGIGPGPTGPLRANFVLDPFSKEEEPMLIKTVALGVEAVESFLTQGIDTAMNKYNGIDLGRKISKSSKKRFSSLFIDTTWSNIEKEGCLLNSALNEISVNTIFPIDKI